MIYHVSPQGSDRASGDARHPLRTISRAAALAVPGDTVRVHTGVYREWVKPACSGLSDTCRIVFEAAPGEHPVIKGSEQVTGWVREADGLWRLTLPNSFFGDGNPYDTPIEGDWLLEPTEPLRHTGQVYLNGQPLYEASSREELLSHQPVSLGRKPNWDPRPVLHPHPEKTVRRWFAQVDEHTTTLLASFGEENPNEALTEINVRPCCFYPERPGISYITVRGFEMAQAATPWAPPTANQPGLIGPHWSRGWIIENNDLHDAKASCVSLGKDETTGHNLYSRFGRKPGYEYQMEAVFRALQAGWSRETVGGHIVRNNVIHDCGQNAIVGHMGCAFSLIEHNHIYNIANRYEYFGHEIAGIKFHAALDTVIRQNCIHDCTLGIWLDWEAQGTRVTGNTLFDNDRDLMVEVTHGPCLVDNNVLASPYAIDNCAQGTALVHNLICGWTRHHRVMERATPYHFPHSTQVAGVIFTYGGDDRLYNNLFTGQYMPPEERFHAGTDGYNACTTPEEYPLLLAQEGNTDNAKYEKIMQPVYLGGNAYAGCAAPFRGETDAVRLQGMEAQVTLRENQAVLRITLPEQAAFARAVPVSTGQLGMPRCVEAPYDNPDGTPVDFAPDITGRRRTDGAVPGPVAELRSGVQELVIWQGAGTGLGQ